MAEAGSGEQATTSRAVPDGYTVLTEGEASILQRGNDVFYNPAQIINRDISIAVLRYFVKQRAEEIKSGKLKRPRQRGGPTPGAADKAEAKDPGSIHILEGLAASGLRSLRYAMEIQGVSQVDANDLDSEALEAMKRNIDYNGAAAQRVKPHQGDARVVMLQSPGVYDAVDLDPYGSPTHFLDSAVQSVSEGGLLLVTATDMAVLCGNNGEACWAKYGSYPLHRPYCHEMALRILLATIESHANRYKRHIVPVVSLSIDFYVRVFVRVYTSAAAVKDSATKLAYVYQSTGCDSFFLQRVGRKSMKNKSVKHLPGQAPAVPQQCPETGGNFVMGGPYWAEPIHDMAWVNGILADVQAQRGQYPAYAKVHSILTAVSEELADVPLYFNVHDICKTIHCTPPRAEVLRSALVNAGYRVSSTHANPLGIKTDAPWAVIWDIMRCWVQDHPIKQQDPESYAGKLLAKAPELKANFSRAHGAISAAKSSKVARFLPNPEANWGPKPKHGRTLKAAEDSAAGNASNGATAGDNNAANKTAEAMTT
ncbi:hypothetical protein WJX72_000916 [[Myrmecia] bisecta]|uniref:tRNA (guanine(26)-N(2))-dimethyltransferase n=1 Tax=[Myrmecia] bisecta TaxID=41462 RepID=A0AAW1PEN2_9CHLO